jgi:hypothetical protein
MGGGCCAFSVPAANNKPANRGIVFVFILIGFIALDVIFLKNLRLFMYLFKQLARFKATETIA